MSKNLFTVAESGQVYGKVEKMLGNNRMLVNCFDGKTRIAIIRGIFKKRVWISVDDIVLLSLRDFQDDKADVILKYSPEDVLKLKRLGELPTETKEPQDESGFEFEEI